MLLGILIFWGIAATSYRGGHITVDLIWANVGPKYQRMIDVFATLVLLFVVAVQTWTLFDKVRGTYNDNVLTFDMHMPTWPFFAVAWAGDGAAVLLIAIRTYRLIFHPEDDRMMPKSRRWSRSAMSTDAVAVLGFVALFALMLLRVPVGMAMGLVGVCRLRLSRRLRAGAEAGRPDLDAHGDRLYLRRDPDVPADGNVRQQFRHEPRTVPRRQRLSSAICAAGSALPPSRPAAALPRSAARRWRPLRRSPRSPIRKCAASAIRNPLPPA